MSFDQNALSVYFSRTQCLEGIAPNEVLLEHMKNEISLVLDTRIFTRDTFQKLYSNIFYSLYLDLFTKNNGMLLRDDIF